MCVVWCGVVQDPLAPEKKSLNAVTPAAAAQGSTTHGTYPSDAAGSPQGDGTPMEDRVALVRAASPTDTVTTAGGARRRSPRHHRDGDSVGGSSGAGGGQQ